MMENDLASRVKSAEVCCFDCAKLYGARMPIEGSITGWDDTCPICGNDEGVYPVRDFGGLLFERATAKG